MFLGQFKSVIRARVVQTIHTASTPQNSIPIDISVFLVNDNHELLDPSWEVRKRQPMPKTKLTFSGGVMSRPPRRSFLRYSLKSWSRAYRYTTSRCSLTVTDGAQILTARDSSVKQL